MGNNARRPVLVVIGRGEDVADETLAAAEAVGRLAIDAGFRLATGGGGGVMEAASRGARGSKRWREGDVVGVLPSGSHDDANPSVDISIPTGLSMARNFVLVSMADVVVAIAGAAGTLSEIAIASQLGRPLVALATHGGWAGELAGRSVGENAPPIARADSPQQAIEIAQGIVNAATHA